MMITIAQLGEQLQVHRSTLRRWTERGYVRALKTPTGHWRFTEAEVERLIAAMQQQPPAATTSGPPPAPEKEATS